MNQQRGKFIVIDGIDGTGKTTQINLLVNNLKKNGYRVEIADFPQYGTKSAGLVEEYLNGKYGSANEIGPYKASIFYACDRYDASFKIKKWLDDGIIVIADRYAASNMAHQGGKINNLLERKIFLDWLDKLEYEIFNIPRPDINIILHINPELAQKLVDKKSHRDYINGQKRDIHEADLDHLRNAEMVYLKIAASYPEFKLIECAPDNNLMTPEEIQHLVWREVTQAIKYYKNIEKFAPDFRKLHEQIGKINYNSSEEPESLSPIKLYFLNQIKVERLFPGAKLPSRAHQNDAGLDLYSADYYSILPGERAVIKTGIKMAIPKSFAGLIWDKGGVARDGIHTMAGVVDSDFRGEVLVALINLGQDIYNIAPGQKIAQMLIQKTELPRIVEVKINDATDRGEGKFGSTGIF